jgi:hypothetical protein
MARINGLQLISGGAWLVALLALAACAGAPPVSPSASGASDGMRAQGPDAVFPSVQAAALDALAYAHLTATPRDRLHLRAGAVHRVANGYSYSAPRRATTSTPLMHQSVRLQLHPDDVASYAIPPRSAERRSSRSHAMPIRRAQHIVDELDPAHRPIYVLTGSLDVVSYSHGERPRVVTNLSAHRQAAHSRDGRSGFGHERVAIVGGRYVGLLDAAR